MSRLLFVVGTVEVDLELVASLGVEARLGVQTVDGSARLIRTATISGSQGRIMSSASSRSRHVRTVRSDSPV